MTSNVDCKVVLLGGPSVGKTCLLERYIHGRFDTSSQATIAGSFASKRESLSNTDVILGCWDTAGSERYASISRMYYRNARAAVVCFDLTDRSTYDTARKWATELRTTEEECKLYYCGTKLDIVLKKPDLRQIDKDTALQSAHDLQSDYFETSSKTGENIGQIAHWNTTRQITLSVSSMPESVSYTSDVLHAVDIAGSHDVNLSQLTRFSTSTIQKNCK